MKVIIFEDEKPAAQKLINLLKRIEPEIEIIHQLDTVEEGIEWLSMNQNLIDLIFMDVNLADGTSFEIFKSIKVTKPIIFITAYNTYAIDAFKVNSIDYILKPIEENQLLNAISKFKNLKKSFKPIDTEELNLDKLNLLISKLDQNYKTRFMIKVGEHIRPYKTESIPIFYSEGRNVSLVAENGRQYVIDNKMEDLELCLDPKMFFRVNRSNFINFNYIKDVIVYSASRLKIIMNVEFENEIIVSREKTNLFKTWLNE